MKKHIISVFVLIFYANVFCYSQTAENDREPPREVFVIAEQPPEFPGGVNAFREYMAKNASILIRIPDPQQRNRRRQRQQQATATQYPNLANFTIERDGSISHIRFLRTEDINTDTENRIIRALQEMPKWTPGKQRGRPVEVSQNMQFRLLP